MGVTNEKAGSNPVHLATLISGEDQTNDVIKTEQQFSYSRKTADGLITSGAGFLHTVTLAPTDTAALPGSITLYDNTAESGTVIFTTYFAAAYFAPVTLTFDVAFTTGLYAGFSTTNDVAVTVSYR